MKSFTLIELMVVVSIIAVLSILVIPNFHLADSRISLERAAYKLAQDIRSVEEMSMSARGTPASLFVSNFFPQGGYGLYFKAGSDSTSYIIFADCDGDEAYNVNETGSAPSCAAATKAIPYPHEKFSEIFLDTGIKIKQKGPGNQLDSMTFVPPDPTIKMQPSPASKPSITLYHTRESSKLVYICVNKVGNIEIKSADCN